jgi:hypothetical protein
MPRFFFDVDNGPNSHSDDTGVDIDTDKVIEEAGRFLRDLARDEWPRSGEQRIRVNVRDAGGQGVYEGEQTVQDAMIKSRGRD